MMRSRIKNWIDREHSKGSVFGKLLFFIHFNVWKCGVFLKVLFIRPGLLTTLNFDDINPDKYPRIRLQLFGPTVIKEVGEACRNCGIHPFLAFGTLLGYYRENRFIKYDSDIDLGLMESDIAKVPLLETELGKRGYAIRRKDKFLVSFKKSRFEDLHVDFFIHYPGNNETFTGTLKDGHFAFRNSFSPDIFQKLTLTHFYHQPVWIPGQPEKYLAQKYGDWRTPEEYGDIHNEAATGVRS